jgi:hypothetical protein
VPALRVAIVVPTIVLLDQWREELLTRSNLPTSAIGLLGGGEGNIEPADYKALRPAADFLRFLSLRYEKRRSEIDAEIADPKSDLHTTDEQLALTLSEDPDLYTSKQVFLVAEDARWDDIIKIARTDDVKLRLDNILALLEKAFPKLKGLLPPIYAGSNLDKENIAGLINLFSKDIFRFEAGGIDKLGRVYEYFIGEFASSEGKRGGEKKNTLGTGILNVKHTLSERIAVGDKVRRTSSKRMRWKSGTLGNDHGK